MKWRAAAARPGRVGDTMHSLRFFGEGEIRPLPRPEAPAYPAGGYRLARPAETITLGEVLTAIDGPGEPPRDSEGRPAARVLAAVWQLIRDAERRVLDQTSIAQLAARTSPQEWVI